MPDEAGDTPPPAKRARRRDEDEPTPEEELPDLNFTELLAEIGKSFEPAASLDEAGLQLTTGEVFSRLKAFYPADTYSPEMVFDGLKQLGFKYADPYRDMNYVWLFK